MSRIVLALMLMMGVLLGAAVPQPAQANTLTNTNYGEPPQPFTPPVSPYTGENEPYLYDMSTSLQVSYWGQVVDGIGMKFASLSENMSNLDTTQKIWDFIEEHDIDIHEREAQVLCLFMERDDPEPDEDVIADFPSWPNCGGILETMFGPSIIPYLKERGNDEDRVAVYQYLFQSMGIAMVDVLPTINERLSLAGGPGVDDLTVEEDIVGDMQGCYTPATNIKRYDPSSCGVLCTVTRIIMGMLNTASEGIVEATAGNDTFRAVILSVLILYVTIYGAMVVLGLVNVAIGDAVVRMVKLGVVAMLMSETVMTLFHMARCFFIEGTTYLINAVMVVGVEAVASLNAAGEAGDPSVIIGSLYEPSATADLCGASFDDAESAQGPLVILEALLTQVFSAHMFLTLVTLFLSQIYGSILAIFLVFGLFGFVLSLLGAVVIYLSALIGQYLLLSLLPFFVAFILFERTQHLFQGWLNQLITYSLTPIFLFAYISLFVVVVSAALAQILDVKICYAKWFGLPFGFDILKPTFFDPGPSGGPMAELPFGFFEVLIFTLLVFLMKEFENSVEQIARDIGNSYVYVNRAARELQGWFQGKANQIKGAPVRAAKNLGRTGSKAMRGGLAGHSTSSSSGQRGVGGMKGAAKAVSSVRRPGGR